MKRLHVHGITALTILMSLTLLHPASAASSPEIIAAEIVIDAPDTPPGNGVQLELSTDAPVSLKETMGSIDISDLSPGAHTLVLRFKDATGEWSQGFRQTLFVEKGFEVGGANRILTAEVFFDTDPGQGQGIPVDTPEDGAIDMSMEVLLGNADLTALEPGPHTAYTRFKDSADIWSDPFAQPLFVPYDVDKVGQTNTIVAATYSLNGGAATTLPPEDGQYNEQAEFGHKTIIGAGSGASAIQYRFQDSTGRIGNNPATVANWGDLEPQDPREIIDNDWDGLADTWETKWFSNLDQDGDADPDGDGYTNQQELFLGYDPTTPNTRTYSISGVVSQSGIPMAGIPLYLETEAGSTTSIKTDTTGQFEFNNLVTGNYTLTPAYTLNSGPVEFFPASRSITISNKSTDDVYFHAAYLTEDTPLSAGHLLGDPDNNGMATPSVGFGVNAVTGNYFHQEVDAVFPGKELPFVFSRAYNRLSDNLDGFGNPLLQPLGPNWTHSFNIQLRFSPEGNKAEVIWGDGRRDGFAYTRDNEWTPETPGNLASLKMDGAGWEITQRSRIRYKFNASGYLTAIKRAYSGGDHTISIQYENNQIKLITDTAGREILFHYNEASQLSSIGMPGTEVGTPRFVKYEYDGGDRLMRVIDRNDNVHAYEYSDIHMSLFWTDSTEIKLETLFDSDTQKVREQNPGHDSATIGGYLFTWDEASLTYQPPIGPGATYFSWDSQLRTTAITVEGKTIHLTYTRPSGPQSLFIEEYKDFNSMSFKAEIKTTDLTRMELPDGRSNTYDYNDTHEGIQLNTANGLEVKTPRNAQGKVEQIETSGTGITDDGLILLGYTSDGLTNKITSQMPKGVKVEVASYTSDGQPLEVRHFVGDSTYLATTYEYDLSGRKVSETDHRGTRTCYFYDNEDNITDIVSGLTDSCSLAPASETIRHTKYEYDKEGRVITKINGYGGPEPHEVTYRYNTKTGLLNRACAVDEAHCIEYVYDGDQELVKTIHANGREDRFYRMASGNIQIVQKNANQKETAPDEIIKKVYDNNGQLLSECSCTQMEYPGDETAIQECVDAIERHTISWNNELGRPASETVMTDLQDLTKKRYTIYSYRPDGLTTTIHKPEGHDVVIKKSAAGQLLSVTESKDDQSSTATYKYDADGNLIKITDPANEVSTFEYDRLGRMTSKTDLSGTVTWNYNDNDGIIRKSHGDGSFVEIHKDRLGQTIKSLTSDGIEFTYAYDSLGRLIHETWDGENSGERVYAYDKYGNVDYIEGPFGIKTDYAWDNMGRLTDKQYVDRTTHYTLNGLDQIQSMDTTAGRFNFRYQSYTGALGGIVFPNGVDTTYERNALGELIGLQTQKAGTDIALYNLTLDGLGRRTSIDATQPLSPSLMPEDLTITHAENGQIDTLNGLAVTHDMRGNLTQLPAPYDQTLGYDTLNRLMSANSSQNSYDSHRNRIEKTENGETTRYLVDINQSLPDVLAAMDEHNKVRQEYVHGPGGLLAMVEDGTSHFVHQDFNYNVIALTDDEGSVTDQFAYSPYGTMAGRLGNTSIPFGFAGGVGAMTDADRLIYMRARYYHSGLRQFTSADLVPGDLMRPQSLARYGYVEGMALGGVDPSGLFIGFSTNWGDIGNGPDWAEIISPSTAYVKKMLKKPVIKRPVRPSRKARLKRPVRPSKKTLSIKRQKLTVPGKEGLLKRIWRKVKDPVDSITMFLGWLPEEVLTPKIKGGVSLYSNVSTAIDLKTLSDDECSLNEAIETTINIGTLSSAATVMAGTELTIGAIVLGDEFKTVAENFHEGLKNTGKSTVELNYNEEFEMYGF